MSDLCSAHVVDGYDFWLIEKDMSDGFLTKHVDAHRASQTEIDAAASEQMRHDAEAGRAIREFIEQPTDKWETVDLNLRLDKGGAAFDWQKEIDNKVLVHTHVSLNGESKPDMLAGSNTLRGALVMAGLIKEEENG